MMEPQFGVVNLVMCCTAWDHHDGLERPYIRALTGMLFSTLSRVQQDGQLA
jgi:hypothetical protein